MIIVHCYSKSSNSTKDLEWNMCPATRLGVGVHVGVNVGIGIGVLIVTLVITVLYM